MAAPPDQWQAPAVQHPTQPLELLHMVLLAVMASTPFLCKQVNQLNSDYLISLRWGYMLLLFAASQSSQ